jgi:hypothetical protein
MMAIAAGTAMLIMKPTGPHTGECCVRLSCEPLVLIVYLLLLLSLKSFSALPSGPSPRYAWDLIGTLPRCSPTGIDFRHLGLAWRRPRPRPGPPLRAGGEDQKVITS